MTRLRANDQPWGYPEARASQTRGLAIHTQNTIYLIDAASICVAVIDRRSGRQIPRHPLIGCVLTGCRRDQGDGYEFQTVAEVGWQAMFQEPGTRPSTRVDLCLVVTSLVQAILPL